MRICIIYDCLYPHTVGGAQRWYRQLTEGLADAGHEVVYLTRDQWSPALPEPMQGVTVIAASPRGSLYAGTRRAIAPTLSFGAGVFWHLATHGRAYDAVICASFPFFSTLAALVLRPVNGYRLVVDWWEVWTDEDWKRYLGPVGGRIGALVQRSCARMPHTARSASRLHAARLQALAPRLAPLRIGGIHPGASSRPVVQEPGSYVIALGRHIPEKGIQHVIPALAAARIGLPGLTAIIAGDGPLRDEVHRQAEHAGLSRAIELTGFVDEPRLRDLISGALCLILPSSREGYGLAVLDAASLGVPSVLIRADANAATELVEPGVNGVIALSASADDLASAILSVHRSGMALRQSTADWWFRNADRLVAADGIRRAIDACSGATFSELDRRE
jgi:glycosyltransferase involved in cell wall biosynthesis